MFGTEFFVVLWIFLANPRRVLFATPKKVVKILSRTFYLEMDSKYILHTKFVVKINEESCIKRDHFLVRKPMHPIWQALPVLKVRTVQMMSRGANIHVASGQCKHQHHHMA